MPENPDVWGPVGHSGAPSLQGSARRASSEDQPVSRPSARSSGCTTRVSRLPPAPHLSLPPGQPHSPPGPWSPDTRGSRTLPSPTPQVVLCSDPQPPGAGGCSMPSCPQGFLDTLEPGRQVVGSVGSCFVGSPSGSSPGRLGARVRLPQLPVFNLQAGGPGVRAEPATVTLAKQLAHYKASPLLHTLLSFPRSWFTHQVTGGTGRCGLALLSPVCWALGTVTAGALTSEHWILGGNSVALTSLARRPGEQRVGDSTPVSGRGSHPQTCGRSPRLFPLGGLRPSGTRARVEAGILAQGRLSGIRCLVSREARQL